jgi:hypothetical protein
MYDEDPQIMFDDGNLLDDLRLFGGSLDKLGTAAQQAFQGALTSLKDTAGLGRDPNGELFPGGVNNISVTVTVPVGLASVILGITVSGPPPTPLFPKSMTEK